MGSRSDFFASRILPNRLLLSMMPALLYIISNCPCLATVVSIRLQISSSFATSQWTQLTFSPSLSAIFWPRLSSISAITTLAPCSWKRNTVLAPMPFAPPVTIATLPSSLMCIAIIHKNLFKKMEELGAIPKCKIKNT